jgi:hypothetical protein
MSFNENKQQFFDYLEKASKFVSIENESMLYELTKKLVELNSKNLIQFVGILKQVSIDETVDEFRKIIAKLTLMYIDYLYSIKTKNDVLKQKSVSKMLYLKEELLKIIE